MARTAITATVLASGGSITDPTGTATGVGAGNGVTVSNGITEQIILRVTNGGGASATVSVKAGSGVASTSAGQGDLTSSVAASATVWLGPFESARFQQSDGTLAVDSSAAVTVTAFRVNRH